MGRLVITDTPKRRLQVVEPRTRRRITPEEVERGLGAERVAIAPPSGSPTSAYAVRRELFARLHSKGGRPGLDGADIKPRIPMRQSSWSKLKRLAKRVESDHFHPTPAQVASIILETEIDKVDETMGDESAVAEQRMDQSQEVALAALTEVPIARKARDGAHDLIAAVIEYFFENGRPINEVIFVPFAIMSRIIGTHDSIQLLLKNEQVVDAAVIALTQFELRLDLAWAVSKPQNATRWVEHSKLTDVIIKVRNRIKALFPNDRAFQDRLDSIYTHLCGIKHGNPAFSELVYGGRSLENKSVMFSTGTVDDEFTKSFAQLISDYSTYQLAWCCQAINVYVAKYAVVNPILKERLRGIAIRLEGTEAKLSDFMTEVTARQQGFFDLQARRDRSRQVPRD